MDSEYTLNYSITLKVFDIFLSVISLADFTLVSDIKIFQKYFIENVPEEKWLSVYEKLNNTKCY